MPWSNNGGGNGGGGWQGGGGGNRGPWGRGPQGGGNQQPPDIDELIRKGQEKLKEIIPGGGGTAGPGTFALIFGALLLVFLASSSIYRVDVDQQGVVLRFGKLARTEPPGLHVKLPYPIETVYLPNVTRINRIDIGMRDAGGSSSSYTDESLMLTGDENIVDISFTVRWQVKPNGAANYLFNVEDPENTVKAIAESAMREVVGESNIQSLLTTGRGDVQTRVKALMQTALDEYKAGINVTEVQLQNSNPPSAVIDAFRDVQAAQADQERMQFEANAYANKVVPQARGQASQITQAAEAYREQTVAAAQGETKRFLSIYAEYKKAEDVTRRRMYLETMQDVYSHINKVLIEGKDGQSVLPYLPLSGLKTNPDAAKSSSGATTSTSSTASQGSK